MRYGCALGLIFGLFLMGSGYGQSTAVLPAPSFATSSDMARPSLTAQMATFFPGVGEASDITLASCEQGCGEACVDGSCGSCGDPNCCGRSCCKKGIYVWGEFLYLNPRDSEVTFAVPIDGPIGRQPPTFPIPVGPAAVLDPDFSPGYRVGFALEVAPCSRLGAEFTSFESQTFGETSIAAPNVIRSNVAHPLSASATTDFLSATGLLDIDFKLVDVDYRHTFIDGCSHSVNYLVGARYGHLNQNLRTRFVDNSIEEVDSNVTFDGGGIRFGLEAEKHNCRNGLMMYGKAIGSLVAGDFQADYQQRRSTRRNRRRHKLESRTRRDHGRSRARSWLGELQRCSAFDRWLYVQ